MNRTYQLSTCPMPVVVSSPDPAYDTDVEDCGGEVSIEISVHSEGAEFGVWADGTTECGHSLRDVARAAQDILLGIEP